MRSSTSTDGSPASKRNCSATLPSRGREAKAKPPLIFKSCRLRRKRASRSARFSATIDLPAAIAEDVFDPSPYIDRLISPADQV